VSKSVNHPEHYQSNRMEVIDVIEAFELNFNLVNVIKYVLRAEKKKARQEDLMKALWYLNREVGNRETGE
jgi:CRISPR/Cas system-associated protein Cas7 (RAMP superfamily)